MPKEKWTKTSDVLIIHGRRICKPRPLCDLCAVREDCLYYQKVIKPALLTPKAKRLKPKSARASR
jgi:endonuclease-3